MADHLLSEWDDRLPWKRTVGGINATEILRGSEDTQLAVVLAEASGRPNKTDMRNLLRERAGGGVAPVLIAVTYPGGDGRAVALLGLDEDAVPVHDLEVGLTEKLLFDALESTSPSGLHAEVSRRLGSLSSGVASGLRNEGLFASNVLEHQPTEADWAQYCGRSLVALNQRGTSLLEGLGYTIEVVADGTVLREAADGQRRAAAVLLAADESFENPLARLYNTNAVTHGLNLARNESLDWLVVIGGPILRLYPVSPDVGVGRKGQTQTYIELDLSLLTEEQSGYLALFFSASSLRDDGVVQRLLDESAKYAAGLSERLRDRIYVDVVPSLAVAVGNARRVTEVPEAERRAALDEAYHQTMIILFRLLFVAYGEDRGLLPYEKSPRYTRNALKRLALDMVGDPDQGFSDVATTLWDDLTQVWKVIDVGDLEGWGVPAYNGGLFTRDPSKNRSGAETYALDLTNSQIGPALRGLLVDLTPEGPGPVDFRSLSVREFGTIYEGLLESGLGVATADLALDQTDTYVTAKPGDKVAVRKGTAYFHSRSGTRKATGSYFTKPFAVEHLLDSALEPAVDRHLRGVRRLLDAGATKSAADALFDFRVADLSMGSAHFLVAAVDRIEARFSAFLAENPMPEVAKELHDLRVAAAGQLGTDAAEAGIDDGALLRRQIARRCVYGVDINEIAVELARLALWIHTFVPGLPLSFLNHGLLHGNSLTGIGTLPEVSEALLAAETRELKKSDATQTSGLDDVLNEFLDRAREQLTALGQLSDASIADVAAAAEVQQGLELALLPLSSLCDLITAERATRHLGMVTEVEDGADKWGRPKQYTTKRPHPDRVLLSAGSGLFTSTTAEDLELAVLAHPHLAAARKIARSVSAAHLPVAFPEVFRRLRPGFDCILGNPPWDEVMVEAPKFWQRYMPGLMGLKIEEQTKAIGKLRKEHPEAVPAYEEEVATVAHMRKVLLALPYEGLGTGDVDYYQIFAWRALGLTREEGHFGVVFPRSLLNSAGTAAWRETALDSCSFDVTVLVNSARWAFDMEPRYTIALVTLHKGARESAVRITGPFHSLKEYEAGRRETGVLSIASIREATTGATFPMLPSTTSADVLDTLRKSPRLDAPDVGWNFRPVSEFHATLDRPTFDSGGPAPGRLPVYTGASFNIWEPDFGDCYAWGDPEIITSALQAKRVNQIKLKSSAFHGLTKEWAADPATLPMLNPRIAYRDVARSTDVRTMIAALLPPGVPLTNKAPYLLNRVGDARTEAYLIGVLSSIPLDWYCRRYVETSMSVAIVRGLPIPRPAPGEVITERITEVSGTLAATDNRYGKWATEVGVPVRAAGSRESRELLIEELDALVALQYGLSEDHVTTIFETFHRGWDYEPRLKRVLEAYRTWGQKR
jgi:hypothetical protein